MPDMPFLWKCSPALRPLRNPCSSCSNSLIDVNPDPHLLAPFLRPGWLSTRSCDNGTRAKYILLYRESLQKQFCFGYFPTFDSTRRVSSPGKTLQDIFNWFETRHGHSLIRKDSSTHAGAPHSRLALRRRCSDSAVRSQLFPQSMGMTYTIRSLCAFSLK